MLFVNFASAITYYIFFEGSFGVRDFESNIWNMFNALGKGNGTQYQPVSALNTDNVDIQAKNTSDLNAIYISGVATSNTNDLLYHTSQFLGGTGLEKRALLGYEFLIQNYGDTHKNEKDEIKCIGWSRGSATCRMLANYISTYGLSKTNIKQDAKNVTTFEKTFLDPLNAISEKGPIPKIKFLGLFDSVAGIDVDIKQIIFPGERVKISQVVPDIVEKCSHAVAINEQIADFKYDPIKLKDNWTEKFFVGNHLDIGGFVSTERQKISLNWIIREGHMEDHLKSLLLPQEQLNAIGYSATIADIMEMSWIVFGGIQTREIDVKRLDESSIAFAKHFKIPLEQLSNTTKVIQLLNQTNVPRDWGMWKSRDPSEGNHYFK